MADEPTLSPDEATSQIPGDQTASSPDAPDASALSSSAADQPSGETHEALLEAVQQAVPELRTSQSQDDRGSGASPAQVAQSASTQDADLPDDPTPEELARYSQSANKRVTKLLDQRRDLRAENARLKGLEPSAQAADSVTKYLRDNDISREDFLLTLELAAAMRRGDFRTFYAGVQPYVKLAEEYLGVSLPPDLQEQVRQGHMTTQAAHQFSRERMDRAMAQNNYMRTQQQHRQSTEQFTAQQQQTQRTILANQVRDTVNAWEAKVMQSDPDYAAKRAAVQDTMWAVVRERGVPQSADHAVKIAEEALRRVNERYRSWAPQRRPTSRAPSSTGRTTGATPEPKTLADAVKVARETARL
ncbi:hypothetical protein ABIG06_006248 [Bradyrhizobium sp. USDA 326]|uniref:hypothetical protein n=1 Tax=unclassified Bradyrhizobium TaxID=2631580 RepID=UPI0035181FD5